MAIRIRASSLSLRISYFVRRSLLYGVLTIGAFVVTFPFLWMVLTSFKTYAEAIAIPPTLLPQAWVIRIRALGLLINEHPGVLALFSLWLALGIIITWRLIPGAGWKIAYLTIHIIAFFPLGNLDLLGPKWTLRLLWQEAVAKTNANLVPFWANYEEAWGYAPFARYFLNSAIMCTVTPLAIIVTGAPAAYAFARLRFPGKNLIFLAFLATMMVPREVILIPNYVTVSQLGWIDTYWALIVPWIVNVMSIFFLRQFFMSVPNDLYDAAVLDGCGHFRFLLSVALPLSAPALVSTGLFNFLGSWNALLWPLFVTNSPGMRPIMVGMAYFSDEFGMQVQLHNAAATFTTFPIIVLFLLIQRQFIEGIARTGLK